MTEWILEKKGDSLTVYETGKGEDVAEVLGTEADGRLIAAAPALAQALRQMLREHDCLTMATGGTPGKTDRWPAAGSARNVLALLDATD